MESSFCWFVPAFCLVSLGKPAVPVLNPNLWPTEEVHQAAEHVYGLAWGEFDPVHDGMEVACLTKSGSVPQLSPGISGWEVALRHASESGAVTMLTLKFTGDFTGDGKVDFKDLACLARYW